MYVAPFVGFDQNIDEVGTCKMLLEVTSNAQFKNPLRWARIFFSPCRFKYKFVPAFFITPTLATCLTHHRLFSGKRRTVSHIYLSKTFV